MYINDNGSIETSGAASFPALLPVAVCAGAVPRFRPPAGKNVEIHPERLARSP